MYIRTFCRVRDSHSLVHKWRWPADESRRATKPRQRPSFVIITRQHTPRHERSLPLRSSAPTNNHIVSLIYRSPVVRSPSPEAARASEPPHPPFIQPPLPSRQCRPSTAHRTEAPRIPICRSNRPRRPASPSSQKPCATARPAAKTRIASLVQLHPWLSRRQRRRIWTRSLKTRGMRAKRD